jgi:hypothetical protein
MCFYGFSNLNSSSVCRLMRHRAIWGAARGEARRKRRDSGALQFVELFL